ncbi:MAG: uroporphyrinogen decarboxylase family protein [Kiritimatiellia bacterium]
MGPKYGQGYRDALFTRIADYNIAQVTEALRYDIDGVYFGDDWGQQTGLIMGYDKWKTFIAPQLKRMYGVTRKAGKFQFIHSCGDVDELFPDLIDLGVNCFNPFQPEVMDVAALHAQYKGSLSFWGGLSTQQTLPYGDIAAVREESQRLLGMGREGSYIFSPAHAVEGDVPLGNILAFIEEAQKQEKPNPTPPPLHLERAERQSRKTSLMSESRSAFTLVELLVVVAIIALLISLVVPVVSSARDRAASTMCLSNQRQIGAGLLSFAAAHQGRFPVNIQNSSSHNPSKGSLLAWTRPPAGESSATAPRIAVALDLREPFEVDALDGEQKATAVSIPLVLSGAPQYLPLPKGEEPKEVRELLVEKKTEFRHLRALPDPQAATTVPGLQPQPQPGQTVTNQAGGPPPEGRPVARYVFSGEDPMRSTVASGSEKPGAFTVGKGLESDFNPGSMSKGGPPLIMAKANTTAASEDGALKADDYFAFTVDPGDQSLNLTAITFEAGASWSNATYHGVGVYTSVDGFSSPAAAVFTTGNVTAPNTGYTQYQVDLSAGKFQNLGEPLEVRLYVWDGANASHSELRIDTVILHGD